jgi:hypothetical protein
MQIQDPVSSWHIPEESYDAGNREWFPVTEKFWWNMFEVLPPTEVSRSRTHGLSWAVSEPWKHTARGEPVYLFFRDKPAMACRVATPAEMHREIFPLEGVNAKS